MRCLLGVSVLAFAIIFRFSLAEISLDEEFLSKEAFSENSNSFFNDGWQDTEGSTLGFQNGFNDAVPLAKLDDDDLMFASACDSGNDGYGGNDNLNKLRVREKSSCTNNNNEETEGVAVSPIPQIFQSGQSALEVLGAAIKTKSPRCSIPPYVYNVCCDGWLGPMYAEGPPQVFTSIDGCYLSMILIFLLLLLQQQQYLS